MLKNYLKIAWRNLIKNKTFSIINIAGLSIGLSCFLLIALYVFDEFSYDKYNTNANRIYRIDSEIKFGDFVYNGAETPAIMGPSFAKDNQQVERFVRLKKNGSILISKAGENIREDKVVYADPSLFQIFTLPMITGSSKTALAEPYSLVITESTAKKYFNSVDVVGKTLLINEKTNYKITGVIKDIPQQSHFNFDFFMSASELEESRVNDWSTTNFQTYVLLKPGTDKKRLEKQFNRSMTAYQAPQFKKDLGMSMDDFEKAGDYFRCTLMPLSEIHLHSGKMDELGVNGSIERAYIFSAIAVFILLIACVNFVNLSTARSSNRAKEVGVRKVFGGLRNNLIAQFLVESLIVSLLSFVLALCIASQLLPLFNQLADKHISAMLLLSPWAFLGLLLLMIGVGLVSGSYPAFFLSSFQPISVLKGNLSRGFKRSKLRNTLVVFQFSISIILMIGTTVIHNQLNYIQNKDIGFNKEQVLVIENTYILNAQTGAFRNELMKLHGVKNVTATGFLPVNGTRSGRGFVATPAFDGKNFTLMQLWPVDESYIPALQIKIKSGRNFSSQLLTDSSAVVLNEAAAKSYGSESPISKRIYRVDDFTTGKLTAYTIIGVIKNFNFNSLHEQIAPLVLTLQQDNGSIALRINTAEISSLLIQIKNKWKDMAPSQPFSYSFLDDKFDKQYNIEQRTGNISIIFSALAILIACLGLFGLLTYAAEQRLKEIGIRKVLGASISDIVGMLWKDFVKLILLSFCIASPAAWWLMNHWLQDFAYRIHISWLVFVLAGASTFIIAFITIIFQTTKAAVANPVKSLRTE